MNVRAQLDHFRAPLVLGTLGAGLLHAYGTGQVKNLLHPLLQPWVLAGGCGLLAAAFLHLLLAPAPEYRPAPETKRLVRRGLRDGLLVLALLGGLALAPRDFSSLALANRQGADPTALLKDNGPVAPSWQADASGAIPLETTDLFMAAEHPDTLAALDGKKVRFHGQLAPGAQGEFKVVRFVMFCCAADAQPVAARVAGAAPAGVKPMGWVEANGTVRYVKAADGTPEPLVTLDAAKAVPEPADKFLY